MHDVLDQSDPRDVALYLGEDNGMIPVEDVSGALENPLFVPFNVALEERYETFLRQ